MKNIEKVNAIFKNVRTTINSNMTTHDGKLCWNLAIGDNVASIYSRFCLTENEINFVFHEIHKYFKRKQIYVSWSSENGLEFMWIYKK